MFKQIPNYLGNLLYKYFYSAYKPLYFVYKKYSDRDKIVIINEKLKPDMIAIDIGANIGFYTLLFSKLVGTRGRVFAFEPEEENFGHLQKNTGGIDNIVAEKLAVGSESGEISLFKSNLLNVDHQTFDTGESRKSKKIKCVALDDYMGSDAKVDFIKIDIQGYDYFAIRGMVELIERSKDLIILGEIWPYGLKKSGATAGEYISFLKEKGFEVNFFEQEDENNLIKKEEDKYFYTDFYAIKKRK